ncbi:hypothetical protein CYMTET_50495 [Cymbomonas tetramitiformis]|uniref:Uncharacterized protein n=1 Tax=Cymbomonas tetramitiformis TaxID=36881 RepID=A0AAE0ETF3_9CHLO|nr:hypothetical protein CYMTET_50495 [Cymbomonas tetramitiformis]
MFLPDNKGLALSFLFINLFCWGSWPTWKKLCGGNLQQFGLICVSSELITAFAYSISLGMLKNDSAHNMDGDTFFAAFESQMSAAPERLLAVLAGGFALGHGDLGCAAAQEKIPSAISFPIYGILALVEGTALNLIIESAENERDGSDLRFVFAGLMAAVIAICLLSISEIRYKNTKSLEQFRQQKQTAITEAQREGSSDVLTTADVDVAVTIDKSHENAGDAAQTQWLRVCFAAGFVTGFWSPLSSVSMSGDQGVSNPYLLLFVFQVGQSCALPSVIYLYGMGTAGETR